jgi:hypothetical protein
MCGWSPDVAPEVNKAKCFAGCAIGFFMFPFVTGIISFSSGVVAFGVAAFGLGGWVSSIGGLLSLIAGLMLRCCGPKSKGQGGGLHRAAAVLAILSTICYLVGAILCVVAIIRINADPANAFRRPCTSLPCPFASCSSRCEMLFDDLENSFGYDDGEAAKRWYESGGSGWVECDPVWELSIHECCKNSCDHRSRQWLQLKRSPCDDYDVHEGNHCWVAFLHNAQTMVFSLIAICLQIPLIIFSFKAKKVIDAEAKL